MTGKLEQKMMGDFVHNPEGFPRWVRDYKGKRNGILNKYLHMNKFCKMYGEHFPQDLEIITPLSHNTLPRQKGGGGEREIT